MLGIEIAMEQDPGGPYLLSSLDLMEYDKAPFVGHPGITLQFYLHGLLNLCYHFFNGDESLSIQTYTARNVDLVYFWAKCGMSLLHILSFLLLLYFATLMFSKETATIATILYATSFAPMYYYSRISPEPIIVIIFLAVIIILYKIYDSTIPTNSPRMAFAVLALAILSVAAIITKPHILAITPIVILFSIIHAGLKNAKTNKRSYTSAVYMPLLFAITTLLLFFPLSSKIDWPQYLVYNRGILQGDYHFYGSPRTGFNLFSFLSSHCVSIIGDYLKHIKAFIATNLLYHFRTNNITSLFIVTEWTVLATAAYGSYQYFARKRNHLSIWIWVGFFLLFNLSTYIIKPRFNYLFLFQVIFSIFAAYGLNVLFDKYLIKTKYSRIGALAIALLVMHYTAIYSVINSRFDDVKMYRSRCQPYYEAINKLQHDHKLGIVFTGNNPVNTLPLDLSIDFIDPQSHIVRAINSTHIKISKDRLLSLGSKAELVKYLEKNQISSIIEVSVDGHPFGNCIAASNWINKQYGH